MYEFCDHMSFEHIYKSIRLMQFQDKLYMYFEILIYVNFMITFSTW